MLCDLCNKELHPLDAHMGRLGVELITTHIVCWNREIDKQNEYICPSCGCKKVFKDSLIFDRWTKNHSCCSKLKESEE